MPPAEGWRGFWDALYQEWNQQQALRPENPVPRDREFEAEMDWEWL